MYITNTVIPFMSRRASDDRYAPDGEQPLTRSESLAQGIDWDQAYGVETGLSDEALGLLDKVAVYDELELAAAEGGKAFRVVSPEKAKIHDSLRRAFNKAAGDVVYPESQMHFPLEAEARTECARTATAQSGAHTESHPGEPVHHARIGILNDPVHGLVPMSTYDVRDFVKSLGKLGDGKLPVVVDMDGPAVDHKEVGDMLAGAAGTKADAGRMLSAAYDVVMFTPGKIEFEFYWR
jgi:hypothetical protein